MTVTDPSLSSTNKNNGFQASSFTTSTPSQSDEPEYALVAGNDWNQSATQNLPVATPVTETVSATGKPSSTVPPFASSLSAETTPTPSGTYTIPAASTLQQPSPSGAHIYHKVARMKLRRKRRTVTAGIVGGAVGLVFLGPLGAVLVGATSAMVTKSVGKRRERRKLSKLQNHQHGRPVTAVVTSRGRRFNRVERPLPAHQAVVA